MSIVRQEYSETEKSKSNKQNIRLIISLISALYSKEKRSITGRKESENLGEGEGGQHHLSPTSLLSLNWVHTEIGQ